VVVNKVSSTTQSRVLQVLTGEASAMRDNIPEGVQTVLINADMTKSKLDVLEERLRMIEGASAYEFGNAAGLCLVLDVVIPPKFKVPEFEKYKGATCPKSHLIMYCRKMAAHAQDEKLLMHFFQDSLAGMSLNWYMHLESTRVRSWKDLVDAFLKQYKYNIDMAPDRMLQNMAKKRTETFKEYAQRWRELSAQVAPPLHESERITMFVETLEDPFYELVLGSVSSNFSDLVTIGERVERGLKRGKVAQNPSTVTTARKPRFNNSNKKKEGEVQAASTMPYWEGFQPQYQPNYRPSSAYVANTVPSYQYNAPRPRSGYRPLPITHNAYQPNAGGQNFNQAQNQNLGQRSNPGEKTVKFTPISMTYTELLPDLLKNALVSLCPAKTLQSPYPKYYNASAKCEYHSGEMGHSTENCRALKFKVQSLIDSGWLTFQEQKPSVDKNPLTGHANTTVNVMMEKESLSLVRSVTKLKKPLSEVFGAICQAGLFKYEYRPEDKCGFHASTKHSIDECAEFKYFVQDPIDRHILQVSHQKREGEVFAGEEWIPQRPKPLVIRFTKATNPVPSGRQPLVIQTPSSFPYKDDKVVPWKYGVSIIQGEQKHESANQDKAEIENISGVGGMTRSGRLFTPPDLRGKKSRDEIKEEMVAEKAKSCLKGKAVQVNLESEGKEGKEITDKDACEFVKFIQQREYKVVDQLNRMPAKVSLLELLMHSDSHRKLLMKILSRAHVEQDISLDKFEGIVSHITANNYLTFIEDEIP